MQSLLNLCDFPGKQAFKYCTERKYRDEDEYLIIFTQRFYREVLVVQFKRLRSR